MSETVTVRSRRRVVSIRIRNEAVAVDNGEIDNNGGIAINGRRRSGQWIISCASLCILLILHPTRALPMQRPSSPRRTKRLMRSLQGGALSIGKVIDPARCYSKIDTADLDGDGKLSPAEYLSFLQNSAGGLLDTNQWGWPITEFQQLPQALIGIYNYFACGDADYVCPGVTGIDVDGAASAANGGDISTQQEAMLYQVCKVADAAVEKLTPRPTGGPTVVAQEGGGVSAPTGTPSRQQTYAPTFKNAPKAPTQSPTKTTPLPTLKAPLNSPTKSPVPATTAAPTMSVPPPCPPLYDADASYGPGDLASHGGFYYRCKLPPQSGWCDQEGYEPGSSLSWDQAWTLVHKCIAGEEGALTKSPAYVPTLSNSLTSVASNATKGPALPSGYAIATYAPTGGRPTREPTPAVAATVPPSSKLAVGYEELYSGPLPTTFQYEIHNVRNLDADGILADDDAMSVLLETTAAFVEIVVADTFGQRSNENVATKDDAADQNPFDRRLRGKRRRLRVLLRRDSVAIKDVEQCSDPSTLPAGAACQKVTAVTVLTLVNEPHNTTMLQFKIAISRALINPGMSFPPESNIVYAGPTLRSTVIPEVTEPNNPPGKDPPAKESGGTPGWVVPVSIAAAATGSIVLLLFAGNRIQKRKRSAIEYHGYENRENDILGGLVDGEGSGSYAEVRVGTQAKVSPLDANCSPYSGVLEDCQQRRQSPEAGGSGPLGNNRNPFLSSDSSSSSSSSVLNDSFSQSFSSTSSSDEDISDNNRRESWKQRDGEVMGEQNQQVQAEGAPKGLFPGQQGNLWQLSTLHEVSEENLSLSNFSLMSGNSEHTSDKSVYRAGVEALVKEACPEEYGRIDSMMAEYEGREEMLIGHLSTMLADKHRRMSMESDTDDEDGEGRRTMGSENTYSTYSTMSTFHTISTAGGEGGKQLLQASQGRKPPQESERVTTAIEKSGGSASAAVAAALFTSTSTFAKEDLNHSSSSSAGSSDWSSDDGFSSIDTSSLATNDMSESHALAPLPDGLVGIGGASTANQCSDGGDGSKPTFAPVSGPAGEDGDDENDPSPSLGGKRDSLILTRESLHEAIEAGDWKAVGATAALIAAPPGSRRNAEVNEIEEDLNASAFSVSSHERREVDELEQLVEAGNWEAVMAATTRFEVGESDRESGSLMESDKSDSRTGSRQSTLSDLQTESQGGSLLESRQSTLSVSQMELQEGSLTDSKQSMSRGSQAESLTSSLMKSNQSFLSDWKMESGGLMESTQSTMSDSHEELAKKPSSGSINLKSSRPWASPEEFKARRDSSQMKLEIEELVKTVVPDEYDNLDEMLLQFEGREEELLKTLRIMRDKDMQESEVYAQLGASWSSLHHEGDSTPSIFENSPPRSLSTAGTSSFVDNNEDVGDIDSITTGDYTEELRIVCSRCSQHLPKSEYSGAQLRMGDAAMCVSCVALSA